MWAGENARRSRALVIRYPSSLIDYQGRQPGASVFSRPSVASSVSLEACFARSRPTKDRWNPRGMLMPSVLIIEDDENGRRAIAKLFARADWKVFEAADGDSGVELSLRNRREVIL